MPASDGKWISSSCEMHERYAQSSLEFRHSVSDVKKLITSLRQEHAQSRHEAEHSRLQIELTESRIDILQQELADACEARDLVRTELASALETLARGGEEQINLRAELCLAEGKLANVTATFEEHCKQLNASEENVKTMERHLNESLAKTGVLERTLEEANAQNASESSRYASCRDEMLEQQNKLESENVELKVCAESLAKERNEMKNKFSELQRRCEQAEKDLTVQTAKLSRSRMEKRKFQEQMTKQEQTIRELADQVKRFDELEASAKIGRLEYERLILDLSECEAKLQSKSAEATSMEDQIASLQRELNTVTATLLEAKERDEVLVKREAELTSENVRLSEAVHVMEAEVQVEAHSRHVSATEMDAHCHQLEGELETTREELKNFREKSADLRQSNVELQFQVRELERQIGSHTTARLSEAMLTEQRQVNERRDLDQSTSSSLRSKTHDAADSPKCRTGVESSSPLRHAVGEQSPRRTIARSRQDDISSERNRRVAELENTLQCEEANRRAGKAEQSLLVSEMDGLMLGKFPSRSSPVKTKISPWASPVKTRTSGQESPITENGPLVRR